MRVNGKSKAKLIGLSGMVQCDRSSRASLVRARPWSHVFPADAMQFSSLTCTFYQEGFCVEDSRTIFRILINGLGTYVTS